MAWFFRRHRHQWYAVFVDYMGRFDQLGVRPVTFITHQCVNAPCLAIRQKRLTGWVPLYGYEPPDIGGREEVKIHER